MGRAVILIAGLVLVATLLSTEFATAQESNKFLDETSGTVGKGVTVTGTACPPYTDILILYDDEVVAKVQTKVDCSFSHSFEVPHSYAGEHKISAIRASNKEELECAIFTVEPGLRLIPNRGPSPSIVIAEGTGFGKESDINFSASAGANVTPIFPNSGGSGCRGRFKVSIEISLEVEINQATIIAQDSDGNTAKADFIFEQFEPPPSPPPAVPPPIEIPPAPAPIAPNWIYAVIGIAVTLAVVVIVLIVRTRGPRA